MPCVFCIAADENDDGSLAGRLPPVAVYSVVQRLIIRRRFVVQLLHALYDIFGACLFIN